MANRESLSRWITAIGAMDQKRLAQIQDALKAMRTDVEAEALITRIAMTPAVKLRRAIAKQDAGAVLAALLTALDDHIDAADEIADAVLRRLGIPDLDEMAPASVPPVGMSDHRPGCPACGRSLVVDNVCPGCGWRSPDAMRPTEPVMTEAQADAQALAVVSKRGRVLSAANEGRIRQAREHLDGVLAQLERQPVPSDEDEDDKALATLLADDAPFDSEAVLMLLTDDDEAVATVADIQVALLGALRDVTGALVRDETVVALDRARGRVD